MLFVPFAYNLNISIGCVLVRFEMRLHIDCRFERAAVGDRRDGGLERN